MKRVTTLPTERTALLHVIDATAFPPSPLRLAALASTLRHSQRFDHRVIIIGGQTMRAACECVDMPADHWLHSPGNSALTAMPMLRRVVARRHQFAETCCWSRTANRAMRLIGRGGTLIETSATDLPPAVMDATILAQARPPAELARRWSLDTDATGRPHGHVIALLHDDPRHVDAKAAMMATALARLANVDQGKREPITLLVHPSATGRRAAMQLAGDVDMPVRVVGEPWLDLPWRVLPGCTLALVPEPGGSICSLAWSLLASVPVVTGPTETGTSGTSCPWSGDLARWAKPTAAGTDRPRDLARQINQALTRRQWGKDRAADAMRDLSGRYAPAMADQWLESVRQRQSAAAAPAAHGAISV